MFIPIHASVMPSLCFLTSRDLLLLLLSYSTCHALYLFILLDFMSNDAILGVTGEELDVLPQEAEEETPRQLAKWTPDDVL